jgi:hypothetical protein
VAIRIPGTRQERAIHSPSNQKEEAMTLNRNALIAIGVLAVIAGIVVVALVASGGGGGGGGGY